MKNIYAVLALSVLLFVSCHKTNLQTNTPTPAPVKPTAGFAIINEISKGMVLEGSELQFNNVSTNAVSYYWDFGNGITSTEQSPKNISLAPCNASYTITLQVKNAAGEVNTVSRVYHLKCSGKHATQ